MKKVLYNANSLKAPRKPRKPKLKDVFELKGSHKMADGSVMSGKTHSKKGKLIRKAPARGKKKKNKRPKKQRTGY